jgi:hypothetical protein
MALIEHIYSRNISLLCVLGELIVVLLHKHIFYEASLIHERWSETGHISEELNQFRTVHVFIHTVHSCVHHVNIESTAYEQIDV